MSTGGFVLRFITIMAIGIGVFFASMALTMSLHSGELASASERTTGSTPSSIAPLLSADPVVVSTTAPSTQLPVVETTTTIVLPVGSRTDPLPELDEIFAPLIEDLDTRLDIPVRVPAELADSDLDLVAGGEIDINGYIIHIDQEGSCADGGTCRVATFTARQSTSENPQLGLTGTEVPLPNGITGRFTDGTCGEDCNHAFITWIEGSVRYSVGSNTVSGTEVLDLAWRSIDRSLPAPTGPEVCGDDKPKHDGRSGTVLTTDVPTGASDDAQLAQTTPVHWVAVCGDLGTDVEIIAESGEVKWVDVDRDGEHDIVVSHPDSSNTLFVVDDNRPRAVIDLGTLERLEVGELRCIVLDGESAPIDASTNELLEFASPLTVRRVPLATPPQGPGFEC